MGGETPKSVVLGVVKAVISVCDDPGVLLFVTGGRFQQGAI